jgi:hypothetical protein
LRRVAPLPAAWLLNKSMFFAKRTQLKNSYMSGHECVREKMELGSFCKKRQKTGKKVLKKAPEG